ncbi:hypothetical protein G4B88_008996 [Cannabis sativa]|uniref:Uncharacterized protein n=1 Tax=Cannabis sativa TaxID=3483 RepID=A0A7J6HS69_CANSA|nr:hypothetical protein G4B88_008996 [Cannabis sativa]
MDMVINIKERTMVKPAKETPKDPIWLSNLDLMTTSVHITNIYLYRNNNGDAKFFDTELLKHALAKVLVPFYPLAGRLRYDNGGRLEINCNSEGVLFMVAETESVMDDLVGCAPTVELLKLTPFIDRSAGVSSFPLLAAQKSRNSSSHVDLVVNEDNNTKLLRAQAHIWNHIFNFINSMSLKCAVELGIPDIINNHGKPMTISQLTLALPINKNKFQCLYRLMRLLTHSGFFALEKAKIEGEEEEEGYVITEASKLLLKDNPMSVTPFLLLVLNPVLTKSFDVLNTWFQNDDSTPFVTTNGMAIWDYCSHEPKLAQSFNEAMASDARLVTSVLIKKCKGVFEGVDSLVDVGGGTGTVAKSIATTFPQIQCSVLDLPHVVAGLQGEKNLNFIAGDMFVEVPTAQWILHDWSDENSIKILKKCKEAITRSEKKIGKVIVIDMIIENEKDEIDDESYETQLFMDMALMTLFSGQERNEKELSKLFKDAGNNNGDAKFFDTELLKHALAKVLVPFYPLAGRLRYDNGGRLEINCNSEGVLFMVAETDSVMDDLVGCALTVELLKLTPFIDRSVGVSSFPLLAAQVSLY